MEKKKSAAENRKMKKQRLMDEAKLQKLMQNYFIKPSNVGGQNQPEESPHFSRQASSLMDIDDHAETDIQSVVVDETHYNQANVEPKTSDDDIELKTDEDDGIEP